MAPNAKQNFVIPLRVFVQSRLVKQRDHITGDLMDVPIAHELERGVNPWQLVRTCRTSRRHLVCLAILRLLNMVAFAVEFRLALPYHCSLPCSAPEKGYM